jgi:PP-loop superfamily ATP-utilizing enzyme
MGVLLAKLQVSHAGKEGMKVKTTQVLSKIKDKLVDIIWTDGYISETACKKTLQDHHKMVQDVSDKFAVKRTTNIEQIQKVSEEKRLKRESSMNGDIQGLIEDYKKKEHSKYENTEPLWDNWSKMKQEVIFRSECNYF